MADTKKTEKKFSTYKGRPLVRCNDEIYYGSMEEPYVSPRKQLVKSSEKKGLFLAMDIADIWLERALANKM